MKRVLIVLPTLEGGGAERFNLELAAALRDQGTDCTIFCLFRRGPLLDEAAARGVPVVGGSRPCTASWRLALALLVGLPHLWRLIRRSDVVIAGLEGVATVVTTPLARLARRPLIAEVHVDLDGKFARPGLIWRSLAAASRRVYPRCRHVVAISAGAASSLARIGVDVPVSVIPNAVNAARLDRLAGEPQPDADLPVVVAVGRLARQKSFDTLVHAHAVARGAAPHRLLILGEGDERANLERLAAELGVEDTVELPGFSANPYAAMRNASALCLSSRYEGMPTVLLEALALGCPVVATDCSEGVRFALGGGERGVLTPPDDPGELARVLTAHLRDPSRLRARAAAAARVIRAEQSYEVVARRYLELMGAPG